MKIGKIYYRRLLLLCTVLLFCLYTVFQVSQKIIKSGALDFEEVVGQQIITVTGVPAVGMGDNMAVSNDNNQCYGQEKTKVYFLKVHKTGSTTMRNILQRFTLERNLTLPITARQHLYPSTNITKYLIPLNTYWQEYNKIPKPGRNAYIETGRKLAKISEDIKVKENQCDIFAVHSVFNKEQIMKLFPKDVVFIATLRHPLQQMISSFHMWDLAKKYHLENYTDPIEEFLKDPEFHDKMLPSSLYSVLSWGDTLRLSYTQNYVAYEFGFDLDRVKNESYVLQHLQYINRTFEVVLITERFAESLILLKRKMCWTYKDIIYIHLRNSHSQEKVYANQLLENHRKWTKVDYLIYDMFRTRHERLVEQGGPAFTKEVATFERILHSVRQFCLHISHMIEKRNTESWYMAAKEEIGVPGDGPSESFTLSGADCAIMSLPEGALYKATRVYRYPQLCDEGFMKFLNFTGFPQVDPSVFCKSDDVMKYNIPYKLMTKAFWTT